MIDNLYMVLVVYYKHEPIKSIPNLIDICDKIAIHPSMKYSFYQYAIGKYTRRVKFVKNRDRFYSELQNAINVAYTSVDIRDTQNSEDYVSISIDLYYVPGREGSLHSYMLFSLPKYENMLTDGFHWFVNGFETVYAHIFVCREFEMILAEESGFPCTMWDDASEETEKWGKEIKFYYSNTGKLDEYIKKAYWGNYLGKPHVDKLGGFEKIKQDLSGMIVEPMPNGGAYLQLAESPYDFGTPKYKQSLKALDDYFSPIILPNRPEVMWDYYDVIHIEKRDKT